MRGHSNTFFDYSDADFQFFREQQIMTSPTPLYSKSIASPVRVGVVGLGRMGIIHALHIHELSPESVCARLQAVSTMERKVACGSLSRHDWRGRLLYSTTIEALAGSGLCDVTIIATNTELHREHALLMMQLGQRVFLEKPLTGLSGRSPLYRRVRGTIPSCADAGVSATLR